MNRTRPTLAGVLAMALLLVLMIPAAALAQDDGSRTVASDGPTADLERVKQHALAAIDRRLERIDRLQNEVALNAYLTDEHAAQLEAVLASSESGLQALADQIAAATTPEQLRELIPGIVEDYRIYVLVTPQVRLVIAADTAAHAVTRFQTAASELEEAIERIAGAGYDTSDAVAAHARMVAAIEEAAGLVGGVAPAVLELIPPDWPDPGAEELEQARQALVDARQALREARNAAEDTVQALREAVDG